MSWRALSRCDRVEVADSPVETARFGCSFARAVVPATGPVSEVVAAVDRCDADVLVLRHPAQRLDLAAALSGRGRLLLPADTLVYWRLRVGAGRAPDPAAGMVVSTAERPDDAELEALVAGAFDTYPGHYRVNPLLDPAAVTAGYVDWVRRTLDAGVLVSLRDDGRLTGFLTTQPEDDHLELVLAGVDASARGRGTYARLIAAAEGVAADRGLEEVLTSTQAPNAVVQRAWARLGYEPAAAFSTVHLVREDLLLPPGP